MISGFKSPDLHACMHGQDLGTRNKMRKAVPQASLKSINFIIRKGVDFHA